MTAGTQQGRNVVARHIYPVGHFARLEHCWNQGIDAKEFGFARVSPYYEDLAADLYWFAGYDGQSLQTTMQLYSSQMEAKPDGQSD